nr:GntR family transcriptional regulator [Pseudoruegeria sp. HB172150]
MTILHDRLTMAHYRLGEKLRPALLAEEFKVSPNTVREIMLRLSAVGLLEYEDQRGFRVAASSDQRLHELTEFRILLEQQGVTRSIANGGIEWEAQMTAAHHKLSHIEARIARTDDIPALLRPWNAAELEYHLSLMGAAELPILQQTFRNVYSMFRQQIITPERGYSHHGSNVAEHQRILEAALDRDASACRSAIRDHLSRNLLANAAAA